VTSVAELDGRRSSFNLQADLALLEQKIDEIGDAVLVIIDPVSRTSEGCTESPLPFLSMRPH
jgi:hypothetical protein